MSSTAKPAAGQFAESCKYLDWSYFAGAVLDAFRQNVAAEASGGLKASSDGWAIATARRRELARRVRDRWVARSGCAEEKFPYSEDAVAIMYMRFRKRNDEELARFAAEITAHRP